MIDALIIALFVLWALITVLFQFELKFLESINFYGFVPYCRFFAPNPTTTDLNIYCCGSNADDFSVEEVEWIHLLAEKKGAFRFYWNPNQRLSKTINTIARQLSLLQETETNIRYTVPYLRILNIATEKIKTEKDLSFVKFIITRHKGREELEFRAIVFSSDVHRVR